MLPLMDSGGIWNVRGLNSPQKRGDNKRFLTHYNIGLLGFLETRVKTRNFPKVFSKVCHGWSIVTNYQFHQGGRIWLVWLASIFVVNVCEYESQFIHCEVVHKASIKCFDFTMVYDANEALERETLWRGL